MRLDDRQTATRVDCLAAADISGTVIANSLQDCPDPVCSRLPDRSDAVIAQFSRGRHQQRAPRSAAAADPGRRGGGGMARLKVGAMISAAGRTCRH